MVKIKDSTNPLGVVIKLFLEEGGYGLRRIDREFFASWTNSA